MDKDRLESLICPLLNTNCISTKCALCKVKIEKRRASPKHKDRPDYNEWDNTIDLALYSCGLVGAQYDAI